MAYDRKAGWREAFASSVELQQLVQIRGWGQLGPPLPLETEIVPGPTEEPEGVPWLRPPMNVDREGCCSQSLGHWISLGFGRASLLPRSRTSPVAQGSLIQNPRSLLSAQQTITEDQKGLLLRSREPQDELQEC